MKLLHILTLLTLLTTTLCATLGPFPGIIDHQLVPTTDPLLDTLPTTTPETLLETTLPTTTPETTTPIDDTLPTTTPETTDEALPTTLPDETSQTSSVDPKEVTTLVQDDCLTNKDCPPSLQCANTNTTTCETTSAGTCEDISSPRSCVPMLAQGDNCDFAGCGDGLVCMYDEGVGGSVCKKKIAAGDPCTPFSDTCAPGYVCATSSTDVLFGGSGSAPETATCLEVTLVAVGEKCTQILRGCEKGAYCDTSGVESGATEGVCKAKAAKGGVCSGNDEECLKGFCVVDFEGGDSKGVCVDYVGVGGLCVSSSNCAEFNEGVDEVVDGVAVFCNKKDNSGAGVCVNEKIVIKSVGAACDKGKDYCDGRRGLVCETVEGKDVCVQKSSITALIDTVALSNPCTPGSPLSTCDNPFQYPTGPAECRRALTLTEKKVVGTTQCRRALEIVEQGSICNNFEFAVCGEGTLCKPGLGIDTVSVFDPSDVRNPVHYCMKEVAVGGTCDDSTFTTFCEDGSSCVSGTCTATASTPEVPITLSGFDGECSKKSCATGLSCISDDFVGKRCAVPEVAAESGESCSQNATITPTCSKGLFCRSSLAGGANDYDVCKPKSDVGGMCNSDDECSSGLTCIFSSDPIQSSTCVDPKGIAAGATCDPAASNKCGVLQSDFFGQQSLKCLPKGGSSACQVERKLYQPCSGPNTACASGLTCGTTLSVCAPASR